MIRAYFSAHGIFDVEQTHFHADYEMLYISKGWAEVEIGGRHYRAESPCVIFLGNLETHRIVSVSEDYERYVLIAPPESLKAAPAELLSVFRSRPDDFEHVLSLANSPANVEPLFQSAAREAQLNDGFSQSCAESYVRLILVELYRFAPTAFPAGRHRIPPALIEIQRYLDEHFTENLSISEVSAQFYVSPTTLRRLFREFVGCSPKQYILLSRLSLARALLESEGLSIAAVAEKCGFADASHFIRCFKARYGATPHTVQSEK